MRSIDIDQSVEELLSKKAVLAVNVSGGKDSHALAWAMHKNFESYAGPKLLIHADLGLVEWEDSLANCERLSARIGWPLVVVKRAAGGMMERWEARWESSVRRFLDLEVSQVILPWSTPALRFCTSELKTAPISAYLKKRYAWPIISATGVRGQESASRSKQPVSSAAPRLRDGDLAWRPLLSWTVEDVWEAIGESGVAAHDAYQTWQASRVSCVFCIMSSEADLRAGVAVPAHRELYRRMTNLEVASGFSFQSNRWLSDLAPDLLDFPESKLKEAKLLAKTREEIQKSMPASGRLTNGKASAVPGRHDCVVIAAARRSICQLYGWKQTYCDAESVAARYKELCA